MHTRVLSSKPELELRTLPLSTDQMTRIWKNSAEHLSLEQCLVTAPLSIQQTDSVACLFIEKHTEEAGSVPQIIIKDLSMLQ